MDQAPARIAPRRWGTRVVILDLILLNLMALFGCGGLAVMTGSVIHPVAGLTVMLLGLAFANWAWWDVYFK